MKKEFWIEKWQNNQTGFHKSFVHPLLMEYIGELSLKPGDTIFVPLCGKSMDMIWLAEQGYHVIGIELSELAVEQFFTENNLQYDKKIEEPFVVYHCQSITIYLGDFFNLSKTHTAHVNAIYDRAALIALPEDLVEKYAKKMCSIIQQDVKQLLITLEFIKTSGPIGPPFTTSDDKVRALYNNNNAIELLQKVDIIAREEKFKQQGCRYLYERVYLITH
ncbi:MAG: thiopurine S-methyltransferase [Marinicellaceae bacterium]